MHRTISLSSLLFMLGLSTLSSGMEVQQQSQANPNLEKAYETLLERVEEEEDIITRFQIRYTAPDQDPRQVLDLYSPVENIEGNLPVLLFIHGGGWIGGDKISGAKAGIFWAKKGLITASLNYRLVPEVSVLEQVEDVLKAIKFLIDEAHHFGGNPEKIILVGHSSGAHVAALIGASPELREKFGIPAQAIQGVIGLDAGVYDLKGRLESSEAAFQEFWKKAAPEGNLEQLSPFENIKKGGAWPAFFLPYVKEDPLRSSQAEAFVKKVIESDGEAEAMGFSGKTHRTLWSDIGEKDDEVSKKLLDFIQKVSDRTL